MDEAKVNSVKKDWDRKSFGEYKAKSESYCSAWLYSKKGEKEPVGVQAIFSQRAPALEVFVHDMAKVFGHRSEADIRSKQTESGLRTAWWLPDVLGSAGLIQRVPLLQGLRPNGQTGSEHNSPLDLYLFTVYVVYKIPDVRQQFGHIHEDLYFVLSVSVWPTSSGRRAGRLLTHCKTNTSLSHSWILLITLMIPLMLIHNIMWSTKTHICVLHIWALYQLV